MAERPIRFHQSVAFLPTSQLLPLVRACDELGYGGVNISDHLFNPRQLESRYTYSKREDGAPDWGTDTAWPDAIVSIAAMAAATQNLLFTTAVYVAPVTRPHQRRPLGRHRGRAVGQPGPPRHRGGLVQGGVRPDRPGLLDPRQASRRNDRRPARPVAQRMGRVPRRVLRRAPMPDGARTHRARAHHRRRPLPRGVAAHRCVVRRLDRGRRVQQRKRPGPISPTCAPSWRRPGVKTSTTSASTCRSTNHPTWTCTAASPMPA